MTRVAAWTAWWIALFWLWLLLAGEWNRVELVAAALAAAVGASLAEGVRAVTGAKVRIGVRDLATAWMVPAIVFVDFGIVTFALLRSALRRERVGGRFVVRDLDPALTGSSRAWRMYFANITPNALVVDVDDEQRVVLLHDLVPFRKSEEPAA
jgi:multisubunit Na+/H+ antiporter MnhE subunit